MSKTYSICDTHRLPYSNAVITAVKLGTTTAIKFFSGDNPRQDYGFTVRTNAKGYICDSNGQLYNSGVFVEEDATVTATMGDGSRTSWNVRGQTDLTINDGKLLDKDGNVVWSANAAGNYQLDYNHLKNQPAIHDWRESEQIVVLEDVNDTVVVDRYTKLMIVGDPEGNTSGPVNLGLLRGQWTERWGQVFKVINTLDYELILVSSNYTSFVKPHSYAMVSYNSNGDFTAEPRDPIIYASLPQAGLLTVNDGSPDLFTIFDHATYSMANFPVLMIQNTCTTTKRITIRWQPDAAISKRQIVVRQWGQTEPLCRLNAYTDYDFVLLGDGTVRSVNANKSERVSIITNLQSTESGSVYNLIASTDEIADCYYIDGYGSAAAPSLGGYGVFKIQLHLPIEANGKFRLVFGHNMQRPTITNFEIELYLGTSQVALMGAPGNYYTLNTGTLSAGNFWNLGTFEFQLFNDLITGSTPMWDVMWGYRIA